MKLNVLNYGSITDLYMRRRDLVWKMKFQAKESWYQRKTARGKIPWCPCKEMWAVHVLYKTTVWFLLYMKSFIWVRQLPPLVLAGYYCEHTLFFKYPRSNSGTVPVSDPSTRSRPCTRAQKWAPSPGVHTIFVRSGQSTALFSVLSSCFRMASDRAKWSNDVHSHISGTQSVTTTPFCAGSQSFDPENQVWTAP